jgi:hypothetical protein
MSWWRRGWRSESWVQDRKRQERWQRGRKRFARLVAFLGLLLVGGPAAFIGIVCSGGGTQLPRDLIAPFPMPARDEGRAFLRVPEHLVVAQADEFAQHLARASPSQFPHFTAARDYWGAMSTACGVTSREYPFDHQQQLALGVLGAGHTAEQVLKGAYEGTVGRLVEWLQTNDTPEDRFAAETARELARFEHGALWQQFPFFTRLKALWATTPAWGPHPLRKWERRAALSVEYGVKAACAWVGRLVAAAPSERDTTRLHAWVGGTTAAAIQANGGELVSTVGPGSFIVTVPRGDAFMRTIVGLVGSGARILDVAGNDEIVIVAVTSAGDVAAPSGEQPPAGALLASDPRLIDPSGRRLTVRVPLAKLADVFAWLRTRGATIETIVDY